MITENKHITNCYNSINHFFDSFNLQHASRHIQRSLLAAGSNKLWKGRYPADLIHFFRRFKTLLDALIEIADCECIRQNAVVKRDDKKQLPDIKNSNLFCSPFREYESWYCLPGHLSPNEFFNPYKALKKIVSHVEDTGELLDTILQYALSNESFTDGNEELDTLQLNSMLQKLLEAAHLLYVRTGIISNETKIGNNEAE
ncbi:MAG TPA: hypothetical protein VFW07_25160 [Parafilimonas sp.]|nr:hypothetical protein [Parafilimonas sp.]